MRKRFYPTFDMRASVCRTAKGQGCLWKKLSNTGSTFPPLLENQALVLLDAGLTSIAADLDRPWDTGDSRLSGLVDVFVSQFSTPRSIERFLAQLRHYMSMHVAGEIDATDLFLMTFLHLQFPELYVNLQSWKTPLTGGSLPMGLLALRDKQEPPWDDLLVTVAEGRQRADARRVLEDLFPAIKDQASNGMKTGPLVSKPEYFDRYFAHTVPDGDVRNSQLAEALQEGSDPSREAVILGDLLTSTYPGQSALALRKLRASTTSESPDVDLRHLVSLELVRKIAGLMEELEDGVRSMFSQRNQAIYWAAELIRQISNEHTPEEILSAVQASPSLRVQMALLTKAARDKNPTVCKAAQILSTQVSKDLLQNLALGDQASEDSPSLSSFLFIASFGNVADFKNTILNGLSTEFDVETLAARFVSQSYIVGINSEPRLNEFDQELFGKFAPANSSLYLVPAEQRVDMNDVSWPNRRKFVRGRAKPPVQASSN